MLPAGYVKPGAGYVCSTTHKLVVVNQSVCEEHYLPVCMGGEGESVIHSMPSCRGVVTCTCSCGTVPAGRLVQWGGALSVAGTD